MRFMRETERPMEVTDGVAMLGKSAVDREGIAMMLLSVVSGIWPIPASRAPVRKARGVGMWRVGVQMWRVGRRVRGMVRRERVRPRMKMRRA